MTREETIRVLAILKAAYPNAYRGMSRDEAIGMISVWQTQFSAYPADTVLLAVNKLISSSVFPPTIAEVKAKMRALYWEILALVREDIDNRVVPGYPAMSGSLLKKYNDILASLEPMRALSENEPSAADILGSDQMYIT